jgi:predicted carbohydrate-binding protein with CBM5 and CBM33 domain
MAAAANIVIEDGQSTPVEHTFVPTRKEGDIVVYQERTTAATAAGFYSLSISQSKVSGNSSVVRQKIKVEVPIEVLDTVTGLYSYPSSYRFDINVILPKDLPVASRENAAAYLKNLAAHSVVTALIENLDAPF